ncbi:MAG TPA: hypothetical protein VMV98_02135 [Acidobacteriaceae bacterium]|nr:hypothetical protein [Acidobacteriaceae bacterium]
MTEEKKAISLAEEVLTRGLRKHVAELRSNKRDFKIIFSIEAIECGPFDETTKKCPTIFKEKIGETLQTIVGLSSLSTFKDGQLSDDSLPQYILELIKSAMIIVGKTVEMQITNSLKGDQPASFRKRENAEVV